MPYQYLCCTGLKGGQTCFHHSFPTSKLSLSHYHLGTSLLKWLISDVNISHTYQFTIHSLPLPSLSLTSHLQLPKACQQFLPPQLNPLTNTFLIHQLTFPIPFTCQSEPQNPPHPHYLAQPHKNNTAAKAPGSKPRAARRHMDFWAISQSCSPCEWFLYHLDAPLSLSQSIPSKNLMLVPPIITYSNSNKIVLV